MKLAIVARHFPPAISGGARRPFLLARELIRNGHDVLVIAPQICPDVPTLAVFHPHIDPPAAVPGGRTWRDRLRQTVLLPDPDINWARRASRVHLPFRPDWILSTSPPESTHVAGWLLKRRYGCRWAVDCRDHWFLHALRPERRPGTMRVRAEQWLAQRLLGEADAGIAVTTSIAAEIRGLAPVLPCAVIGHFADIFAGGNRPELPHGAINIVHTGSFVLSDPARRVEPVLTAFANAVRRNPRLHLHLVGRLREDELAAINASPARSHINAVGAVSLEAARQWQLAADVLLLVSAPDTPHIPGKLEEYRTTSRPILVSGGGSWIAAAGVTPVADLATALAGAPSAEMSGAGALTPDRACAMVLEHLAAAASHAKSQIAPAG